MIFAHLAFDPGETLKDFLLRLYASKEVKMLAVLYKLLQSGIAAVPLAKEILFRLLVVPLAGYGIVGMPLSPGELESFLNSIDRGKIAVGTCRCRLAHGACDHPLRTDIVISSGAGIWMEVFPDDYELIDREEALRICKETHGLGLAQILYSHMDSGTGRRQFVICNCCSDGCLPLLALRFYGKERYPFRKGSKKSVVDKEKCAGCGTCLSVCPFGSRILEGVKALVDDCFGCGLCVSFCPEKASSLVSRA